MRGVRAAAAQPGRGAADQRRAVRRPAVPRLHESRRSGRDGDVRAGARARGCDRGGARRRVRRRQGRPGRVRERQQPRLRARAAGGGQPRCDHRRAQRLVDRSRARLRGRADQADGPLRRRRAARAPGRGRLRGHADARTSRGRHRACPERRHRRGRPVHDPLHVGDHGPAEGRDAHAPQPGPHGLGDGVRSRGRP